MKAIILAAGKGTRLGNLTQEIPKPMFPINGKPLLEYVISYLKKNEINEIGINLFTMSDKMLDYFGDGSKYNVKIFYSFEDRLMGTAGALVKFEKWLNNEDFIVIYGDVLTNQPLKPLIELHRQKNSFATLFLHKRKTSNSYVEINNKLRIIRFLERPTTNEVNKIKNQTIDYGLVNSAIQIISKDALAYIKDNTCFDLPKDVYSKVLNEKKIYGLELTGDRVAIDSLKRYNEAEIGAKKGIYKT
jgi:mannose-1-phosphate guanylyltransferase / phosphomannomutase